MMYPWSKRSIVPCKLIITEVHCIDKVSLVAS